VAPKNHVKWTLWTLVSAAGAFEKSACAFCDSRMAKNEALKKVGLRKRRETLGMCKKQVDYNSTTLKKTHIRRNQVYPGIYI